MSLVKPWVKAELECILHVGENDNAGPPCRRSRRQTRKQLVQCIEVDEEHGALKINDTDTMVWCFVSKPGMRYVSKVEHLSCFVAAEKWFGSLLVARKPNCKSVSKFEI